MPAGNLPVCPTCGRLLLRPATPTTGPHPMPLIDLPPRFRLNGVAMEIVETVDDPTTGTTTITLRQLLS